MFTSPGVRTKRRGLAARDLGSSQQPSLQEAALSQEENEEEFAYNDDEHTLLRGDRHAVFEVGALPPAARQLLSSGDAVACGLSDAAQFGFVATASTCIVWSFASGSGASEPHRLEMPSDAGSQSAPTIALVAGVGSGDVGLVAVGAGGHVRYWDRVVFGLGGAAQFSSAELTLAPGDRCEQIVEAAAGLFVVAARSGALFRLALGHGTIEARALSRSVGSRGG
ncbi:hypothetical protein IWW38_004352, partial [Coemansia aciculifera]